MVSLVGRWKPEHPGVGFSVRAGLRNTDSKSFSSYLGNYFWILSKKWLVWLWLQSKHCHQLERKEALGWRLWFLRRLLTKLTWSTSGLGFSWNRNIGSELCAFTEIKWSLKSKRILMKTIWGHRSWTVLIVKMTASCFLLSETFLGLIFMAIWTRSTS